MVDPLLTSTPCVDQPLIPLSRKFLTFTLFVLSLGQWQKKVKQNNGMQDINLSYTLIGQSFNDGFQILSPGQSDIQTDIDTSRSNLDLSP